ncbi:MAG: DUF4862 family protein [Bifidobacterium sp.]|uniref:DUF4862 family protein n=1 Tax=Bifidobacterium sp. TaxID=41200 RepID=UPI0039ED820A
MNINAADFEQPQGNHEDDQPMPRIIGAYALESGDAAQRRRLITSILDHGLGTGFEVPILSHDFTQEQEWFWNLMPTASSHVLTMVTRTMEELSNDPGCGLASEDPRGRNRAISELEKVQGLVQDMNAGGGPHVGAIEIQSAPQASDPATACAHFLQSLKELASWDWHGASLCVEHCDALVPWHAPAKGFLSLHDEIDIVRKIRSMHVSTRVGITLNWGRSAIELRDAGAVQQHIRQCLSTDTLLGLMYSGTSPVASDFGPAWSDAHCPMRRPPHDPDGESTSLLSDEAIHASRILAGRAPAYEGIKVSMRPLESSVSSKIATIQRCASALDLAWEDLRDARNQRRELEAQTSGSN